MAKRSGDLRTVRIGSETTHEPSETMRERVAILLSILHKHLLIICVHL
jgi:hypothetical protein